MANDLNLSSMTDAELRRHYVVARGGRLQGRTAVELSHDELAWAIGYNERTMSWLADLDAPWPWDPRDGEESRRRGKTARELFPRQRQRASIMANCRVTLRALNAEAQARRTAEPTVREVYVTPPPMAEPAPPPELFAPFPKDPKPAPATSWPAPERSEPLETEPEMPDWKGALAERLDWSSGEILDSVSRIRKHIEVLEEELAEVVARCEGLDATAKQLRRMK